MGPVLASQLGQHMMGNRAPFTPICSLSQRGVLTWHAGWAAVVNILPNKPPAHGSLQFSSVPLQRCVLFSFFPPIQLRRDFSPGQSDPSVPCMTSSISCLPAQAWALSSAPSAHLLGCRMRPLLSLTQPLWLAYVSLSSARPRT